jgi:formate/nitrite transporter FocA (FNT family)
MALYFSVASFVFSIALIMGTVFGEDLFDSPVLCSLQGKQVPLEILIV